MSDIDISDLTKPEVLAALHNGTRAMGMGALHDIGRDMTLDEAAKILGWGDDATRMFGSLGGSSAERLYFDYVQGRPLKVDITGDSFDGRPYDRYAGDGAAQRAIDALRARVAHGKARA